MKLNELYDTIKNRLEMTLWELSVDSTNAIVWAHDWKKLTFFLYVQHARSRNG